MKNLCRLSLILTVLIAGAVVPAAASARWWTTTPRTVRNFCFLNRGLGPYVTGQVNGIRYAAFDTSHDGVPDAWVFDLDRNGYYDTVVIDNNERGQINFLGVCAAPRNWYTPAAIRAAVQRTQRAASAQSEPASTCAETPGCESFANQQLFDASLGLGSADGIITNPETGNPDGM